jgi:hypothetical protein
MKKEFTQVKRGTIEQLMVTPVRPSELILQDTLALPVFTLVINHPGCRGEQETAGFRPAQYRVKA